MTLPAFSSVLGFSGLAPRFLLQSEDNAAAEVARVGEHRAGEIVSRQLSGMSDANDAALSSSITAVNRWIKVAFRPSVGSPLLARTVVSPQLGF